ncbi:hypothetical protein KP509_04G104000 [Ceratopteris richardii]|uniref:FHA domain-containing protein n=2 Tax=Ceratopteris richardii TaxID=49495 RepID=A0A8T2V2F9_CERRI|nr:hypothetical protein KP509_04G104000 [Ceratopteris richardii]
MATENNSSLTPDDAEAEVPFLLVCKDGELIECMCLDGMDSVVLGRHTNCDLMVTHPSVSRHHLEIQILHTSRELMLTDLDSIHGTWINGEQALPLVAVTAKEGDSIKLGASSRVYSVQWRPQVNHHMAESDECSDKSDANVDCKETKKRQSGVSRATIKIMDPPSQIISDNMLRSTFSECSYANEIDERRHVNEHYIQSKCQSMVSNTADEGKSINYNLVQTTSSTVNLNSEMLQDIEDVSGNASVSMQGSKQSVSAESSLRPCITETKVIMESEFDNSHQKMERSDAILNDAHEGIVDDDLNAEKENSQADAKPALSKLWVRRARSNPPPNLLTSTSSSCGTVLSLSTQGRRKTYPIPSAPPMPFSYLEKSLAPSAPPLSPLGKPAIAPDYKEGNAETIHAEFMYNNSKEIDPCAMICNGESSLNLKHHDPLIRLAEISEEFTSDKENDSPVMSKGYKHLKPINTKAYDEGILKERNTSTRDACRKPFQPLDLSADVQKPSSPTYSKALSEEEKSITQVEKRPSTVVQNLDLMLRTLKRTARSEPRRAWHMIVDSSCFLDSSSFKSLQQLEGIREVRLIIPKIVISELDHRTKGSKSARRALNWIESCMVKLPSWIHVQNSSENLPGSVTPPVSPHSDPSIYGGNLENIMSPTNGDHVVNCALLFSSTVFSGQVAVLTNDIALKIKAMAEGLVCEAPSPFCESLLSPYSGRFLWTSSIAHGHGWTEKPFYLKGCSALAPTMSSGDQLTKEAVISTIKGMTAFRKNHALEGLKKHCFVQAQGLKVALID